MDATTGATIVASVINSSSLNCGNSSSSNSSSGYGSSHSAASTPIGSQYENSVHTPVSAAAEHVPPTATVAPVMPCYSETALGQQQRQQYYQSYAYPSSASQYPIYDAFTGNSYHNLTTPSVERSLGLGSGHHSSSSASVGNHQSSQQQRLEKSSKSGVSSSGTQLYTSSAATSLTTTTSSTTKPQATATPFFAQPSSNVSGSNAAYYDTYGKYKMPSSTKLPSHAASDYASHFQHAVASLSYQHQQQHYYAAAKSQLQDANYAVKTHRQHSVNNTSAYYGNSGTYYDKYEKYMYPASAASSAAYGTAAPTHATHPYSPHEPTTADPYRKVAAAAAANAWHWNMEYNCRNLPPTAAGSSYLSTGSTTSSARDAFCAAPNDKYSKYDKYSAYYASAHHQQYMTPQSSAASSRNLWPNTAHHTPHLASVQHGLNERLSHTIPPSATQHQYPHTHPHSAHQRQSCCAQPFQQQSCYYPRPSQQHAHTATANPYAPPQQSHYTTGGTGSTSSSHKYGAYSSSFKSNNSSNDLFVTSPFDTTPPPAYNYGTASATSLQQRYGASNAAFYNDLSMQTAFDGFANTAPMLQQHNVAAHSTHLGYQTHSSSQNPSTSALLDYRKPTASTNEYCLSKSRAPPLPAMEQHIGPASYLTFDIHGNPIAQAHSVITSPTIYSDGGSSSEKSTPTTKNIRDFLATWSEGEDEESAAAASASAAEQLHFVEGANRGFGMPELGSAHEEQQHALKHTQLGARPKIHVGITVDGSLDVDSSQFINLPDIVIDIEKPSTAAPTTGAAEVATDAAAPCAKTTLLEHHSPCNDHSHEMFENFDVEKELDELQIKRAKLCLEKQLNNEIRILTPEPSESQNCENDTSKPHEQQTTQYQNVTAVHHSDCEKSYERADTFLKEMELNDSTSHSSNGSTFEKEYETFINRIENDKIDVERQHRICNETDTRTTQLPIINEDSGSVSHQSSGIKTPPDPSDIDELAQKACQSVKPLNFSGNPDFETREHEDFADCVQDLTMHTAMESSQKSMDESMALQNFEGPSSELVVMAERSATATTTAESNALELSKPLSEDVAVELTTKIIQAEDLSLSRDSLVEEKNSNSNDSPPTQVSNDTQSHEDFSFFYKKKRKLVQEIQDIDSVQPTLSKQSKPNEKCAADTVGKIEQEKSKPASSNVEPKKQETTKRKRISKSKRRPLSFFYKNLRHWTNARKAKMQALVQQQLAVLKERHLPLIKRQSIKNLSACNKLVYNPSSLKCLTVSIVNTDEFQNHILDERDKSEVLKDQDEKQVNKSAEDLETESSGGENLNEVKVTEKEVVAETEPLEVPENMSFKVLENESDERKTTAEHELIYKEKSSEAVREILDAENDLKVPKNLDEAVFEKSALETEAIIEEKHNTVAVENTSSEIKLQSEERSLEAVDENQTTQDVEENVSEVFDNKADEKVVDKELTNDTELSEVFNNNSDESVVDRELTTDTEPTENVAQKINEAEKHEPENNFKTRPENLTDLEDVVQTENTANLDSSLNEATKQTEQVEDEQLPEHVINLELNKAENLELAEAFSSEKDEPIETVTETAIVEPQNVTNEVESVEPENQAEVEIVDELKSNETKAEHTTNFECTVAQNSTDQVPADCTKAEQAELGLEAQTVLPQADHKEENLKEALEEQSSTTVSENWSNSMKAQEEFNGFEDESNSKQNFNINSNSLDVSVDDAKSLKVASADKSLEDVVEVIESSDAVETVEPCIQTEKPLFEAITEPMFDETDSCTQLEEPHKQVDLPTESMTENIIILDSDSEPEVVSQTMPIVVSKTAEPALTPHISLGGSDSNEQSTPLPPMRTKASVKMCDFSAIRLKRKLFQERTKSKSLNSLKSCKKDKRDQSSLDTQKLETTSIKQKPTFKGIGQIDKTEFVEHWAASISTANNKPKLGFGGKRRAIRADSTEALDLSPTSLLSAKTSPIQLHDENSNSSSSSSSSSNSSDSSCDNKSETSSNSSTSQSSQTSNTSTTSSTSQSSSSDSSTDGSDFNELKALERELSQHKTHDDWANSVAQMCEAENGNAIKTDTIKLEIFETEATNQDIADLKKILESEEDTTENAKAEIYAKKAEVCEKGQVASLKKLAEEFISRQAAKLRENIKIKDDEAAASKLQQIVLPKLSDLCKIALNSSFVINELNVNLKENEVEVEKEVKVAEEKHHYQNHITTPPNTPNAPKSTNQIDVENETTNQQPKHPQQSETEQSQPTMTVEEELAEMYRQAGVASDPEDNIDDGHVAGEHYTENLAQDYLLINLAEILANSDNESNVFVLQCDMNENVLRVMTTSPSADNSNELVIGEVANVDVENSSAVQIVQLVNAEDFHVEAPPLPSMPPPSTSPPPPPPLPPTTDNITTPSPLEQYIIDNDCNNDLPIIHHEEIVPDNYKKYQKEQFLKYLHAKYVQKHVKRFYHAHRISKKYRRRYLSKKVSNSLVATTAAVATVAVAPRLRS